VVTVEAKEVDRDGRTIADVFLADGTNLNRELVKEGLVWWFFKYSNDEMSVGNGSSRWQTGAMGKSTSNATMGV
jgi:endonuclease YncB( thermonuclease family)